MIDDSEAREWGLTGPFDVDALVRHAVRWHFSPATGSPFWLNAARELDFDPLADVTGRADLTRFPDLSARLRQVPVEDLVPAGCRGVVPKVFESGGAIGTPKRIIELGARERALGWVDRVMRAHGVGDTGHWLHIGPTGPHIVGRSVGLLAARHGAACLYVDFDPRWVRRRLATGDRTGVRDYIDHVLDQAETILRTQNVTVAFATPPVIEAACARPELEKLLSERLRTLIWSGTSISDETLRLLTEEIFPATTILGIYGNSLMGIAPQRPGQPDDPHPCVFQPYHPYALVDVVTPDRPEVATAYGERGRVRVNLLTRDMFLPNVLERDTAVRVAAPPGYDGDGLASIRPYAPAAEDGGVIEGVY